VLLHAIAIQEYSPSQLCAAKFHGQIKFFSSTPLSVLSSRSASALSKMILTASSVEPASVHAASASRSRLTLTCRRKTESSLIADACGSGRSRTESPLPDLPEATRSATCIEL